MIPVSLRVVFDSWLVPALKQTYSVGDLVRVHNGILGWFDGVIENITPNRGLLLYGVRIHGHTYVRTYTGGLQPRTAPVPIETPIEAPPPRTPEPPTPFTHQTPIKDLFDAANPEVWATLLRILPSEDHASAAWVLFGAAAVVGWLTARGYPPTTDGNLGRVWREKHQNEHTLPDPFGLTDADWDPRERHQGRQVTRSEGALAAVLNSSVPDLAPWTVTAEKTSTLGDWKALVRSTVDPAVTGHSIGYKSRAEALRVATEGRGLVAAIWRHRLDPLLGDAPGDFQKLRRALAPAPAAPPTPAPVPAPAPAPTNPPTSATLPTPTSTHTPAKPAPKGPVGGPHRVGNRILKPPPPLAELTRLAERAANPKDWTDEGKSDEKAAWKKASMDALKWVAAELGFGPEQTEVSFNPGGVAVSGEASLLVPGLYVMLGEPMGGLFLLYRTSERFGLKKGERAGQDGDNRWAGRDSTWDRVLADMRRILPHAHEGFPYSPAEVGLIAADVLAPDPLPGVPGPITAAVVANHTLSEGFPHPDWERFDRLVSEFEALWDRQVPTHVKLTRWGRERDLTYLGSGRHRSAFRLPDEGPVLKLTVYEQGINLHEATVWRECPTVLRSHLVPVLDVAADGSWLLQEYAPTSGNQNLDRSVKRLLLACGLDDVEDGSDNIADDGRVIDYADVDLQKWRQCNQLSEGFPDTGSPPDSHAELARLTAAFLTDYWPVGGWRISAMKKWAKDQGIRFLGSGTTRVAFGTKWGALKILAAPDDQANQLEVLTYRLAQNNPKLAGFLVPILDWDPNFRWILMEEVKDGGVLPLRERDYLNTCGLEDTHTGNVTPDGRLLDYDSQDPGRMRVCALADLPVNPPTAADLAPLDGTPYFSEDAITTSLDAAGPGSRTTIVVLSPQDFLTLAASGRDPTKAARVQDALDRGHPFSSLPTLTFEWQQGRFTPIARIVGHEGRHRMRALHEHGIRQVPVELRCVGGFDKVVRWTETPRSEWPTQLHSQDNEFVVVPFPPLVTDPDAAG